MDYAVRSRISRRSFSLHEPGRRSTHLLFFVSAKLKGIRPLILARLYRSEAFAVCVILSLGLLLRVWGINFGLPHLYHADEPIVVNHALAYGTGDLNPHFFRIPPLVSYLLFGVYGLFYAGGRLSGVFSGPEDFENLFYSDPSFFYLTARLVFGVFPGVLGVGALFVLVRKFFGRETALWSAALFSVSFLHVRDSHYVYADIPLILCILAALYKILELISAPTLRNHLAAGLLIGLAAAVKYNGLFLVVPFLVSSAAGSGKVFSRRNIFHWTSAGLACCLCFVLLNPYSILDGRFFLQEIAGEGSARAGGTDFFHHLTYSLAGALGYPHLVLSLLGMTLLSQFTSGPEAQARRVIIIMTVSYYLVLVGWGQYYDRYVLPLLPLLSFFAADAIVRCSRFARRDTRFFAAVLFCLAAAFPFAKSVLAARIFQSQDLRTEGKIWVEANLPQGAVIALDTKFYMPPLSFSIEALERKKDAVSSAAHSGAQSRRLQSLITRQNEKTDGYDLYFLRPEPFLEGGFLFSGPFVAPEFEKLERSGVRYLILSGADFSNARPLFAGLQGRTKLLKRFSPYRDLSRMKTFDRFALTGIPFLWEELYHRRQNGQPFEVYEIVKNADRAQ